MNAVFLLIALAAVLSIIMAAAWAVIVRTGKSGWADAFWSLSIGLAGSIAALAPLGPGQPTPRASIVAALVAIWSLRLAIHIAGRTVKGGDDPRYAQLREEWGSRYRSQLFLFLQIQAGAALVLVLTVLVASQNPASLGPFDFIGILIAAVAIGGEALSDAQLIAFKAVPGNRGQICDKGLWSLSRHPNYFFEWLYWLAYVPIGLAGGWSWGWLTLAAPALMYWLLVHVSGIPPLEAHMLRSRGDRFRHYQRQVRAFWPLPRLAG